MTIKTGMGVFDKELMLWDGTETIDQASEISASLLLLGTPNSGLAVRVNIPTGVTLTASQVLTFTLNGCAADGTTVITDALSTVMVITKAQYDAAVVTGNLEFMIPFSYPSTVPYVKLTLVQTETANDLTGLIAGVVLNHKAGDWDRVEGWVISATVPA